MTVPEATAPWFQIASGILSPAERARAAKFLFAEDRTAYVAAHALLRIELAAELGGPAGSIKIDSNALGKPYLVGIVDAAPYFSLTHTRRHVGCAIATRPVGIDIEEPDRRVDWSILSRFHPTERDQILDAPEDERCSVFFRLWTVKEAILKVMGTGLSTPLGAFAVRLDPPQVEAQPELAGADTLYLHFGFVGLDTPMSVAILGDSDNLPRLRILERCPADFPTAARRR